MAWFKKERKPRPARRDGAAIGNNVLSPTSVFFDWDNLAWGLSPAEIQGRRTSRGLAEIMTDWNSGVFNSAYSQHGALIIRGGGHGSYNGNEQYAFDLTTALWERVNMPSLHMTSDELTYGDFMGGRQPLAPDETYPPRGGRPTSTEGSFVGEGTWRH